MGYEDNTTLKPLFEKHIKRKRLVSFDIETHGKNNDFYMGGIYSEEGYKSFYDKQTFLEEFKKTKYYGNTYIVATNLAFDLVGIYYNQKEWNYLDIVMNGGRMIFVNISNKKNKQKAMFIDSFNFAPFSVALMGDILKLPKLEQPIALGKIPQNEEEKKELEIYNKRDCEVTYYFMKLLDEGFTKAGGKMKTTIASTAMDIFRRRYLRRSIKKESAILNRPVEELIFESYYGGRTEVFKRGKIGVMKMYDINSLYPSVMINEYPDPNSCVYLEKGNIDLIKKFEGVSRVKIFCPKMDYPLLPIRHTGKLIFPTGVLESVYTHVELRKALELGYTILSIKETLYYKKTFYPFKDYVIDLYNKRLELKRKNDPNELVYKLLLNSLYGKFAQKNLTETTFFNKKFLEDEQIEAVRNNPDTIMSDDDNGVITKKKVCDESFVLPILSSYTTAYARIKLHEYIVQGEAYYCDTDSIITDKTIPESDVLGAMKVEYDILEGVLVKPKMYYLKNRLPDGTIKEVVKLKGVPKKLLYKGEKVMLNKEIFMTILEGDSVHYEKFTKLKEGVRRAILPNSLMDMEKYIQLTDNKRFWFEPFDYKKLGLSNPLEM